jgi:hypothetical protein
MTLNGTSKRNLRRRLGTVLTAIGSTVLVVYSAGLAWQFHNAVNSAAIDSLGYFGSIGLASLRAVRIATLDHTVLVSVLQRILLLFSALIVTLAGIALLHVGAAGDAASAKGAGSALLKGDQ